MLSSAASKRIKANIYLKLKLRGLRRIKKRDEVRRKKGGNRKERSARRKSRRRKMLNRVEWERTLFQIFYFSISLA